MADLNNATLYLVIVSPYGQSSVIPSYLIPIESQYDGYSEYVVDEYMHRTNCHRISVVTRVKIFSQLGIRHTVENVHISCLILYKGVHKVLVGKPEGKRPLGRPRRRWEDNIKMDLDEVGRGCGDWMELAKDRDSWWALVSTVMNFRVP